MSLYALVCGLLIETVENLKQSGSLTFCLGKKKITAQQNQDEMFGSIESSTRQTKQKI